MACLLVNATTPAVTWVTSQIAQPSTEAMLVAQPIALEGTMTYNIDATYAAGCSTGYVEAAQVCRDTTCPPYVGDTALCGCLAPPGVAPVDVVFTLTMECDGDCVAFMAPFADTEDPCNSTIVAYRENTWGAGVAADDDADDHDSSATLDAVIIGIAVLAAVACGLLLMRLQARRRRKQEALDQHAPLLGERERVEAI